MMMIIMNLTCTPQYYQSPESLYERRDVSADTVICIRLMKINPSSSPQPTKVTFCQRFLCEWANVLLSFPTRQATHPAVISKIP